MAAARRPADCPPRRGASHRGRPGEDAGGRLRSAQLRLEQLPDHPEGERALELGRVRPAGRASRGTPRRRGPRRAASSCRFPASPSIGARRRTPPTAASSAPAMAASSLPLSTRDGTTPPPGASPLRVVPFTSSSSSPPQGTGERGKDWGGSPMNNAGGIRIGSGTGRNRGGEKASTAASVAAVVSERKVGSDAVSARRQAALGVAGHLPACALRRGRRRHVRGGASTRRTRRSIRKLANKPDHEAGAGTVGEPRRHREHRDQRRHRDRAPALRSAASAALLGGSTTSQLHAEHAPSETGQIKGFATVPASALFSSTFTRRRLSYNCSGQAVQARRVGAGGYEVSSWGILSNIAVGTSNGRRSATAADDQSRRGPN